MVINLDRATFTSEAIIAAGYRFTDIFFVAIIPSEDEHSISVSLEPKPENTGIFIDNFSGTFINEVIDQQLRLNLEKNFGHLRNVITDFAFSPLTAQTESKKKLLT